MSTGNEGRASERTETYRDVVEALNFDPEHPESPPHPDAEPGAHVSQGPPVPDAHPEQQPT